jgi:hypothetical protein
MIGLIITIVILALSLSVVTIMYMLVLGDKNYWRNSCRARIEEMRVYQSTIEKLESKLSSLQEILDE